MNYNLIKFLLLLLLPTISFSQNNEKPNETLPVEMVYFVGDVVDSTVEIRWGTATEINNYGYDVLRSDTAFNFENIGFVQGHGNSVSPKDYLFIDTTITENGNYYYLLKQIDFDGNIELTHDTVKVYVDYLTSVGREAVKNNIEIHDFLLYQNYPNPFNPSTNISFSISENSFITLKIYSIMGEEIATLYNNNVTPGTYSIIYKPINLSSGTYIYKLRVGNKTVSKKMLFIK